MQTSLYPMTQTACALRGLFLRVLASLVVGLPTEIVHGRIRALPLWDQAILVGAAIIAALLATLLFAEAGPGGPIAMWGTVWLLSR